MGFVMFSVLLRAAAFHVGHTNHDDLLKIAKTPRHRENTRLHEPCCTNHGKRKEPSILHTNDWEPGHVLIGDLECRECICDRMSHTRTTTAERGGRNLAALLLGHRDRHAFDSVLPRVIEVNVRQGHRVAVFAYLEASNMTAPYLNYAAGDAGRLMGHPTFRTMSSAVLRESLERKVRQAGGRVGAIVLDPSPPDARFPSAPSNDPNLPHAADWPRWRLLHYDERIRRTIAIVLKKELMAYQLILHDEEAQHKRFDWILLMREDAHWLKPFNLSAFEPGYVHGKDCATYGGWNDHVYLIWREFAEPMLSSYLDLHTPRLLNRCWLRSGGRAGTLTSSSEWKSTRHMNNSSSKGGVLTDALACVTSEQWRQRIGELYGIPYQVHSAEELSVVDVRFLSRGHGYRDWPVDGEFSAAERRQDGSASDVVACFPKNYALNCVPRSAASLVEERFCRKPEGVLRAFFAALARFDVGPVTRPRGRPQGGSSIWSEAARAWDSAGKGRHYR